jgi:hypothetical protein
VEEIDARAVLGVSAKASEMEIEAAYRDRNSEVRKRFDDARDHRTRAKCQREREAIEEARRTLLRELEEREQRRREEEERLAIEHRQREEEERLAAQRRQHEEEQRLAAEQRLLEEKERLAAEHRVREEKERLAAEHRLREEKERLAAEHRLREEKERLAAEHRLREEKERLAAEQRQREEKERLATEQRQREEKERLATEQRQREQEERLAAERRQREQEERLAAERRQHGGRIWLRQNIRLLFGGLILVLACVFAAVFFRRCSTDESKPGRLVLNTVPDKADVSLDGVSQGKTPLDLKNVAPGERHLRIELEGYQDEQLIVLIKPGDQRFFPSVTLIPKKEPVSAVTPTSTSPTETQASGSPPTTPVSTSPTETPTPSPPTVTQTPGSPSPVTPVLSGYPGESYPQTRERLLTEAEVANLDYADLQYAINEMYARHGARFLKEPNVRKQFQRFSWYYPIPELTLTEIDGEFSRIESQNRDLLARLRDQKRPR